MGVSEKTLANIASGSPVSGTVAIRTARAAGSTVDALLGAPRAVSTCQHCGAAWEMKP